MAQLRPGAGQMQVGFFRIGGRSVIKGWNGDKVEVEDEMMSWSDKRRGSSAGQSVKVVDRGRIFTEQHGGDSEMASAATRRACEL